MPANKSNKANKAKKATKAAAPKQATFLEMVIAAIPAIKDRKGASRAAIANWIQTNFNKEGGAAFNAFLRKAIKKGLESGQLIQGQTPQRFKIGQLPKKKKANKPKKKKKTNSKKKAASKKKKTSTKSKKKTASKKKAASKKKKAPKKKAASKKSKK